MLQEWRAELEVMRLENKRISTLVRASQAAPATACGAALHCSCMTLTQDAPCLLALDWASQQHHCALAAGADLECWAQSLQERKRQYRAINAEVCRTTLTLQHMPMQDACKKKCSNAHYRELAPAVQTIHARARAAYDRVVQRDQANILAFVIANDMQTQVLRVRVCFFCCQVLRASVVPSS